MLARTPKAELAVACAVKDEPHPRISNWIDISISGPTRQAVESAVAEYRLEHYACDPRPAFYFIQERDGRFVVTGSRGRDPRK